MKRLILAAIVILWMCMLSCAVYSTPSTLAWIPSTDIQAAGVTHLGVDTYQPSSGSTLTDYGLTWGTAKLEYGVDYLSANGIEDPTRLNAKLLLKDETSKSPRVAIGIYDLGGDAGSGIAYALGSKTFPCGRLTFGYGVGKQSVLGDDNGMLMLGIDKAINDKWWAAVDYQSGKSAFGALNLGVAYCLTPTTSMFIGYDWYNDESLPKTLTAQLDINF